MQSLASQKAIFQRMFLKRPGLPATDHPGRAPVAGRVQAWSLSRAEQLHEPSAAALRASEGFAV